jgi:hypothetical protein
MPKVNGRIGALALALVVLGCGPLGGRVELVTGAPPGWDGSSCSLSSTGGLLVADEKYGTAIIQRPTRTSVPVVWRPGFTAQRMGSEVQVLDPGGNIVATTGRTYLMMGGYVGGGSEWPVVPDTPDTAFWACRHWE